jgi:PKHD-type hydroxylase
MDYKPWVFTDSGPGPAVTQRPEPCDGLTIPTGGLGFFSPEECAEILKIHARMPQREAITGNGQGQRTQERRKSNLSEVYPDPATNWIFEKLESALLQLNAQQYRFEVHGFFEGAQIYEYPEGGFLDWHMDIARGYMSNRKLSMSVQLTDGALYAGGDLEFMDFKETGPRGLGDLIVFPSFLQHRVSRLTQGKRYAWVSWVHGPVYR